MHWKYIHYLFQYFIENRAQKDMRDGAGVAVNFCGVKKRKPSSFNIFVKEQKKVMAGKSVSVISFQYNETCK